ncbi:MAG: hypothetical protein ABL973_00500 [Micropepsaceae bacterium]
MLSNVMKMATAIIAVSALQGCSMNMFGSDHPAAQTSSAALSTGANSKNADDEGLGAFDTDHGGQLTKAEFEAALAVRFKKDDSNGDGYLDSTESRALNDRLMADPDGSPVIDWNADGKIMMPEYASRWRTMFVRADINQDGLVDQEEMAGRARLRKPRELPQPELGRYKGKPL